MPGEAWSKDEEAILRRCMAIGCSHEETSRVLAAHMPNSPRTVPSIRGKLLELRRDNARKGLPALEDTTSFLPILPYITQEKITQRHFTEEEEELILVIRQTYNKHTWGKVTRVYNSYVDPCRHRHADGIKKKHATMDRNSVRRRIKREAGTKVWQRVMTVSSRHNTSGGASSYPQFQMHLPLQTPTSVASETWHSESDVLWSPWPYLPTVNSEGMGKGPQWLFLLAES
jgi:hypothetical protein